MRKTTKGLALMLVLAMLFAAVMPVYADQSTMTIKTVYKDNSANTEIYAVTSEAGDSYPYYGAKYEPKGGVYYGRVALGGTLSNGQYGMVNKSDASNESIVSHYTNLGNEYSIQDFSYLWGAATADGKHALLINLNFNDGDDLPLVLNGTYDSSLRRDLRYLGTLTSYPVFLRIGGEMNSWANGRADEFIKAYQYIADMARSLAPNAALVFSPNFSASTKVDMDSFYPGDSYVDWVGVSLYYNKYPIDGETNFANWQAFYGVDECGDAVLNVQQARNLSILHQKPLMITEGGSSYYQNGNDATEFAASRVEKAMAVLTMIYPEIKAIVYSDTNFGNDEEKYSLTGNAVVSAAYKSGVAVNPTLLHGYKSTSYSYYTKLSDLGQLWAGDVKLAAYTYYSGLDKLTATWTVDGKTIGTASSYPYSATVKTSSLTNGAHTVKVEFSNGESKEYKFYAGSMTEETVVTESAVTKHPFTDVKDSDYYEQAVQWAYDNGITKGAGSDTTFQPKLECSRAQVCTFLWRVCGSPKPASSNNPFVDVEEGIWYEEAVLWAVEQGITNGAGSETTFKPEMLCSNGTIMTFIWRAMGCPNATENPETWYSDAVNWAKANNMLEGTYTKTYDPDANCPRCNVVEYLYRYSKTK